MKGILVLAHGSRQKLTEETVVMITDIIKANMPDYEVEYGLLEFSEKSIEAGLDSLVSKGVRDIIAVPYFLFDGVHIQEKIPEILKEYMALHENVTIKLGETIGADYRLAEILMDRVCAIV